jgi:transcription-repair coupling factor (superfamily II helicase)
MTTLEQRKKLYQQAAVATNKRDLSKFRAEINDYYCKYEDELTKLLETIPHWETHLTDKQLQITKLYVNYKNTCAIDTALKLANGVAYHTLFGSMKNEKQVGGVLKKLRNVNKVLQDIQKKKGGK